MCGVTLFLRIILTNDQLCIVKLAVFRPNMSLIIHKTYNVHFYYKQQLRTTSHHSQVTFLIFTSIRSHFRCLKCNNIDIWNLQAEMLHQFVTCDIAHAMYSKTAVRIDCLLLSLATKAGQQLS